ncbi:hypothetical protein SARC_02516 [Sphaeroforma arctica JP610]|uniref:Nudix hydrolase domain-containing protein n=1 Tax=Sphaeroforma arctica JP610 TaxID=667725 RepID=A0A0L0GAL4_9EUKA|nr:hypothetical protein SARC_02516 [Sphaeroforma arctica JP610]KNC85293.1 hypothetical protein SARC_02516 [Sphaeroforma arctica JP610]|eukprot:XP_014159195.1 hypothetical protein SARC_02516 [Sphaeroforma arctica JP610]
MFDPITCDCNFTPGFLCGVLVGANVPGTAPSQQSQADKAPAVFSGDTDSIADELETKLKLKDERESLTGDISGGTLSFSDGSYDKVSIESAAKLLAINRFDATQSYDAETIIVAQVRNVLAIKEPPPTKKLKCTENTYDENINVLRLSPAMFPLVDTCYSAAGVLLVRSSPQPNRCKPGLDRLEVLTLLEFRKKKSNIKQHLPGGKREVYEHMAVHTAAREMFEETGGHSVYVNRVDDEMPHAQLVRFIHNMLVQSIWINSARYVVYVCNLDSAVDEDLNLFNNIETAFGNIPEEESVA